MLTGLAGCSVNLEISCGARKLTRTPRVTKKNTKSKNNKFMFLLLCFLFLVMSSNTKNKNKRKKTYTRSLGPRVVRVVTSNAN